MKCSQRWRYQQGLFHGFMERQTRPDLLGPSLICGPWNPDLLHGYFDQYIWLLEEYAYHHLWNGLKVFIKKRPCRSYYPLIPRYYTEPRVLIHNTLKIQLTRATVPNIFQFENFLGSEVLDRDQEDYHSHQAQKFLQSHMIKIQTVISLSPPIFYKIFYCKELASDIYSVDSLTKQEVKSDICCLMCITVRKETKWTDVTFWTRVFSRSRMYQNLCKGFEAVVLPRFD